MTGYCGAKFEPRYGVLDANAESEHNVRAMSQAQDPRLCHRRTGTSWG